ncbi:MAG: hypothetical protein E7120_06515 [Bacteroidales bacterium]|nr:hypothetical protein [Bacteroidales bacterium]
MKLRYLFSIILSSVLFFSACEEQVTDSWDNIKLSQTYLSIAEEGGSATLTVTATEDWEFVVDDVWPEVIKRDKEGNVESSTPSWLAADKMSGGQGETKVTFSAEATTSGRELELKIKAGDNTQFVRVRQGSMTVTKATVAEIIAGPEGKLYEVKGICTAIANTNYGNWYLKDSSTDQQLYIYGTVDASGKYNWSSFNIEVGDEVTVQGSYVLYGGNTPEFVDATFIKVSKSLVKVITEPATVAKEGGELEVKVAYKGAGVFPTVPEEYRSWVSIVDMQNKPGEPTKIEPNPADTAVVKIAVLPNDGGNREGSVTFVSSGSSVPYAFTQEGAIVALSVADFLAAPEGTALYELTGVVKNIANATYGNFDLVDGTGSVYVYGLTGNGAIGSNDKSFSSLGINEGDVITIIGTRTSYKETPQVGGTAYLKEHVVAAKSATVTEFLAESKGTWCKVTGTIANLVNETYGNFDLVGEDGASVYVYGLTTSYVTKNDKSFANLGLKEGDIVTLVGKRDSYNGEDQVGGPAYYLSHEAGANPWDEAAKFVNGEDAADDALMKEIAAYADAANLYVRVTAVSALDGANYLDVSFCDGNGETAVWWGWTTTGANTYWKEHKGSVDAEGNLTAMQFSFNGEYKDIAVETEKAGDNVVWTLTYPREYLGAYEANGKIYVSSILWNGWDGYWAVPARGNEMLEVTLP